jgi:hypothetical protein
MNVEPTDGLLDRHLGELRNTLVDSLLVADIAHELRSSPHAARLLLTLYTQLGTLQRVVRRTRRVLTRNVT